MRRPRVIAVVIFIDVAIWVVIGMCLAVNFVAKPSIFFIDILVAGPVCNAVSCLGGYSYDALLSRDIDSSSSSMSIRRSSVPPCSYYVNFAMAAAVSSDFSSFPCLASKSNLILLAAILLLTFSRKRPESTWCS